VGWIVTRGSWGQGGGGRRKGWGKCRGEGLFSMGGGIAQKKLKTSFLVKHGEEPKLGLEKGGYFWGFKIMSLGFLKKIRLGGVL